MPHDINVFISHPWKYSSHYNRLSEWIFQESWNVNGVPLNIFDTSVPKDNPIHDAPNQQKLRDAIFERIIKSHIVVIPMGMYANHSKWIQKEIDGANEYQRPILAVDPWGQKKSSSVVKSAAQLDCGWTSQSVINGVWHLYHQTYLA